MPERRSKDVLPLTRICGWCGGIGVIRFRGGQKAIVCPECQGKNSVVMVDDLTSREVKVLLLRGKGPEGGFE